MDLMKLYLPVHALMMSLLVLMVRDVSLNLGDVMEKMIVLMVLMNLPLPVPSCLSAQMTSLPAQMVSNVLMVDVCVISNLVLMIVMMLQMNIRPFANLHVLLICLLVLMAQNVFTSQIFAMGQLVERVVMIFQTI